MILRIISLLGNRLAETKHQSYIFINNDAVYRTPTFFFCRYCEMPLDVKLFNLTVEIT